MAHVLTLRRQLGLSGHHDRGRSCEAVGPDEGWAADFAHMLRMTRSLLHTGIQRGLVPARQEGQGMRRWVVQADAALVERLRRYRQRDLAGETRRRWTTGPRRTSCQRYLHSRNPMPNEKRPMCSQAGSSSAPSPGLADTGA